MGSELDQHTNSTIAKRMSVCFSLCLMSFYYMGSFILKNRQTIPCLIFYLLFNFISLLLVCFGTINTMSLLPYLISRPSHYLTNSSSQVFPSTSFNYYSDFSLCPFWPQLHLPSSMHSKCLLVCFPLPRFLPLLTRAGPPKVKRASLIAHHKLDVDS